MDHRSTIAIAAALATSITLLLLILLTRRLCHRNPKSPPQIPRATSLQTGISKLHQHRPNYYILRRGISSKPLFNWSDNPSLVTDAIENGWSRFAFTNFTSSPFQSNIQSSILGYCGPSGDGKDIETVKIGWEVCEGSTEFVQKIQLNSSLKRLLVTNTALTVVKSALPLPGPALANTTPFPQEAYFEITILSLVEDGGEGKGGVVSGEGEKMKLIQEGGLKSGRGGFGKGEELRGGKGGKEIVEGVGVVLTVGLAGGGSMPVKLPGSYPGSIGFNSDGSVFLEGLKLATESEPNDWGKAEKVIGCGYNPAQKKVYFTVDGKLVREVFCTTEEFGTPLYPTLAANSNVTILVNFGQTVFKYTQANLHRTPNPCFVGQAAGSPILGFEDSRELFSMGRIDAHWLDRSTKRNAQYFGSVNRGMSDYDKSSDGDLFEIVLDSNSRGRSPSMHY